MARKLRAAWGPRSENRVGLPSRCRPTLAGTSPSTSFSGSQTGDASSGDRGGRRALSLARCSRGLVGWAGGRRPGKDLLGKGSPFAFTCHRGPARRSPCPQAVGSALSRLWRSTQRVELAPHVASRASFTQPSREEGERSGSAAHVTGASEYQLCPDGVCACAPRSPLSRHLGPARGKPRPRSCRWEEFQHAQPQ